MADSFANSNRDVTENSNVAIDAVRQNWVPAVRQTGPAVRQNWATGRRLLRIDGVQPPLANRSQLLTNASTGMLNDC